MMKKKEKKKTTNNNHNKIENKNIITIKNKAPVLSLTYKKVH